MRRLTVISQLVLQFPNQIQPGQFDGAPLAMISSMIINPDTNSNAYPPSTHLEPASPEDINEDVLAVLQMQLAKIGLRAERINAFAPPPVELAGDLNHGNGDPLLDAQG